MLNGTVIDLGDLDKFADLRNMRFAGKLDLFEIIHEIKVLLDRHVHIQRRLFGKITNHRLGFDRIFIDVVAADGDFAFSCGKASGNDVHGCGFSGAVGAEEAVDAAFLDGEADAADGGIIAVAFDEVFHFNQCSSPPGNICKFNNYGVFIL